MTRWIGGLSLGVIAASLLAAVPAVAQQSLTVTGISELSGGAAASVRSVPSITVVGGTLSEEKIRQFFKQGVSGSLAADLATLDADSITIPVLTVSPPAEAYPLVVVRNIALKNVVDGKAGEMSVDGIEFIGKPGQQFELGALAAQNLNIAGILGFYGLVELPDRETLKEVYSGLDIGKMTFASSDISCTIEPIHFGALEARPLRPGTMATIMAMQGRPVNEDSEPDEIVAALRMYADILTAYRVKGGGDYGGFNCGGTEDGKPLTFSFGHVTQGQGEPGFFPVISYSDIRIEQAAEGFVKLGNFTLQPIDFNGPLAAIEQQGDALSFPWIVANYRKLIPEFRGFGIGDLSMDVPDLGSAGERTKLSLGSFELRLDDYVNGIPSAVGATLKGLHVMLPPTPENQQLIAMGYNDLNVGADVAIHWDKTDSTLLVDRLATSWEDAGATAITAVLGNATPDLFAEAPAVAIRAWEGLTLKELTLEMTDEGLLAKALAVAAEEQKVEPRAFRSAIAAMAQGTVIVGLAGNADSIAVSQAVTSFILGDSPHIKITATALDAAGISLADLEATQSNPPALLQKVKVTAVADSGPIPAPPVEPQTPSTPPPVTTSTPPPTPPSGAAPTPPAVPTTPESAPPPAPDAGAMNNERRDNKNPPAAAGQ